MRKYQSLEPWNAADSICVSLQSLNIVTIISSTSEIDQTTTEGNDVTYDDNSCILAPISSSIGFGFTIGAPKVVLDCISQVTRFQRTRRYAEIGDDAHKLVLELLTSLHAYSRNDHEVRGSAVQLQNDAFLSATHVYIYRTLLDVPPHTVRTYVSKTFEQVLEFHSNGLSNFSIWPAFIAAVEAYTDEDLSAARSWLDLATTFGLGNRTSIKRVVEEVWRRREALSAVTGFEVGSLAIDWRIVMQELDCDVLLI